MKHKTLTILIIISFLFSNTENYLNKKLLESSKFDLKTITKKNIAFGTHHTTFKIISDSLYYIVSNIANEKHMKKRGMVAVLNENGTLNDYIEFGKTNNYILSGIQLKNKGFMFIGYNKSNNDEWNKIYVIKTDHNLNTVWEKSYGALNNENKGYSIVELDENQYWILGYNKISKNGVLLLKIDGNGNEKWFSYLPGLNCNFATNIIATTEKNLIISGQNSNQLFVSKIDTTGKIIWQYNYFKDTKYHRVYDIKNTDDGGTILVGNSTQTKDHSFDVLMIKLSKNGQEQWIKKFGNKSNEVAYDVEQNMNAEYIISGYALVDKEKKIFNSFIIKTDSLGNKIDRIDFNSSLSNQLYDIDIEYSTKLNKEIYIGTGNSFNELGNSEIWFIKF